MKYIDYLLLRAYDYLFSFLDIFFWFLNHILQFFLIFWIFLFVHYNGVKRGTNFVEFFLNKFSRLIFRLRFNFLLFISVSCYKETWSVNDLTCFWIINFIFLGFELNRFYIDPTIALKSSENSSLKWFFIFGQNGTYCYINARFPDFLFINLFLKIFHILKSKKILLNKFISLLDELFIM